MYSDSGTADTAEICAQVDLDHDGSVSLDEFLQWMHEMKKLDLLATEASALPRPKMLAAADLFSR